MRHFARRLASKGVTTHIPGVRVRFFSQKKVFIEDRGAFSTHPLKQSGSTFFDGEAHDRVHKTTRNSSFKPVSKTAFVYSSETQFQRRLGSRVYASECLPTFGHVYRMARRSRFEFEEVPRRMTKKDIIRAKDKVPKSVEIDEL